MCDGPYPQFYDQRPKKCLCKVTQIIRTKTTEPKPADTTFQAFLSTTGPWYSDMSNLDQARVGTWDYSMHCKRVRFPCVSEFSDRVTTALISLGSAALPKGMGLAFSIPGGWAGL